MDPRYGIDLSYVENTYDKTLYPESVYGTHSGEMVDIEPYYMGRIIRLGISATGSTWNEALDNVLIAASGSSWNTSF